jgi:hypothetical protein
VGESRYVQIVGDICAQLALQSFATVGQAQTVQREPGDEGFLLCGVDSVPDLRVYYREQDRHRNDAPPAVCFVPRGGPIVVPDKVGPQKDYDTHRSVYARRRRMFGFEVYVWGQDLEQTEDLVDNLILAIEDISGAGPADTSFGDEAWLSQQDGNGGQETLGYEVSFTATIPWQVFSKPHRLVRVQHVKITVSELGQQEIISI